MLVTVCCLPEGIINIKNEKWKDDYSPIDAGLDSYVSNFYTKAYLRHLVKAEEILGAMIASVHNLTFYLWLVGQHVSIFWQELSVHGKTKWS
jgi:queuine tRNA-ribosyltransferase